MMSHMELLSTTNKGEIMRALTAKQKKIIEKFHDRTNGIFLDEETEEKVAAVNDYETVYMDAARYLSDYATEKLMKERPKW